MHTSPRTRMRRRAAVVEPYVMQRLGTVELLRTRAGLEVVHDGDSVASLLTWMRGRDKSNWPHLLVAETLPASTEDSTEAAVAEAAVAALRDAGMRILLLSSLIPRHAAQRIVDAGVDGVASKLDGEQAVLECVAAVLARKPAVTALARSALAAGPRTPVLSVQEARVLELYASGERIAVVAQKIGVRQDTARKYLARIKQKYSALGRRANSKLDLARLAREDGLVS